MSFKSLKEITTSQIPLGNWESLEFTQQANTAQMNWGSQNYTHKCILSGLLEKSDVDTLQYSKQEITSTSEHEQCLLIKWLSTLIGSLYTVSALGFLLSFS